MRLGSIYRKIRRFRSRALVVGSGIVFAVIPGCQEECSNVVFDAVEAALNSAIPAWFDLLTEEVDAGATETATTVLRDTINTLTTMLA